MKRRGFTLVELLTVVAILSILAALALPVLARAQEGGRATVCASNLAQISRAVHLYAVDQNDALVLGPSVATVCSRTTRLIDRSPPQVAESRLRLYGATAPLWRCPSEHFIGILDEEFVELPSETGFALCGSSYWLWPSPPSQPLTLSSLSPNRLLVHDSNDFHNGRAKFAFCDGHVAVFPFVERTRFIDSVHE